MAISTQREPKNDDELHRLRELVLGDEYTDAIQQVVGTGFSHKVADVLSESIHLRNQQDDSIGEALSPVVDTALKQSIKRDPSSIIEAISPIIGPSIRKAVSKAMTDLMVSLNEIIERSVSGKAIKWRFEAWRKKVPFARYVLLKNIKYRVDQVFLIHKETGLLMSTVTNSQYQDEDPELVSSMLTAINDFVADSFQHQQDDALERVRFGDRVLQINVGNRIIIAVAVTGVVTQSLKTHLVELLERIESEWPNQLEAFNGDKTHIEPILPVLGQALVEKQRAEDGAQKKPWIAIGLLFIGMGYLIYLSMVSFQQSSIEEQVKHYLKADNHIIYVDSYWHDNELVLELYTDPSVINLEQRLQEKFPQIEKFVIHSKYQRVNEEAAWLSYLKDLYPDTRFSIDFPRKQLTIVTPVSPEFLQQIKNQEVISKVFVSVEALKLIDNEKFKLLQRQALHIISTIEDVNIYFDVNSDALNESSIRQLEKLKEKWQNLKLNYQSVVKLHRLNVSGFTDKSGSASLNRALSQSRANNVIKALMEMGWEESQINYVSSTTETSSNEGSNARRVEFSVDYEELKESSSEP